MPGHPADRTMPADLVGDDQGGGAGRRAAVSLPMDHGMQHEQQQFEQNDQHRDATAHTPAPVSQPGAG